jgi:hypothetical protein
MSHTAVEVLFLVTISGKELYGEFERHRSAVEKRTGAVDSAASCSWRGANSIRLDLREQQAHEEPTLRRSPSAYRSGAEGALGKGKSQRPAEKSRHHAEENDVGDCAQEDCCRPEGEMGEIQGAQEESLRFNTEVGESRLK